MIALGDSQSKDLETSLPSSSATRDLQAEEENLSQWAEWELRKHEEWGVSRLKPFGLAGVSVGLPSLGPTLIGSASTVWAAQGGPMAIVGLPALEIEHLKHVLSIDLSTLWADQSVTGVVAATWAVGAELGWPKGGMTPPPGRPLRGNQKLQELKRSIFDTRTKEERVGRALRLLSGVRPIEGLDEDLWRRIEEEVAFEDQ